MLWGVFVGSMLSCYRGLSAPLGFEWHQRWLTCLFADPTNVLLPHESKHDISCIADVDLVESSCFGICS